MSLLVVIGLLRLCMCRLVLVLCGVGYGTMLLLLVLLWELYISIILGGVVMSVCMWQCI